MKVWDLKLRNGAFKLRFGTKIKARSQKLRVKVWDLKIKDRCKGRSQKLRAWALKLRFGT